MQHARVIIVGGGIVGCSIAYHLSRLGWKDIVVLEKGELTSGSTWHAAGLVGQLRSSRNITRMLGYSVEDYEALEDETGQPTGWKKVGGLRLASSTDRMLELRRAATMAKSFGLEMHLISPKEAHDLFPLMDVKGVVGAAFLPTDGYADPSQITQAFAKGARANGVTFQRGQRVLNLKTKNGRVSEVVTGQGSYQPEVFVNAAGMWARELGLMTGVNVPLIPVQHQYMVSDQIPDIPTGYPTMRDPDHLVYYKEEAGGVVMGGYEPNPIPWSVDGVPKEFGQELLESDVEHFSNLFERAVIRTPLLGKIGMRKLVNGPEAFTTDGNFLMGPAPELRDYFVCAGFNAHGIAAGGGAGRMMAEWIAYGEPSLDLWAVDIRRFAKHTRQLDYVVERTSELYGKHYTMHWPFEEHESGRGQRLSQLYDRLKEQGAVFGSRGGWERPNWFAPPGVEGKDDLTFGRPNWFEHVGNEHRAIRERVGLIDQSSFSKYEVEGPGALKLLNYLSDNNVEKPPGRLTYTQFCNKKGGIESDLTIARINDEKFYIVTGTAFGPHDEEWIRRHMPTDGSVTVRDVTDDKAVLNVCGPRARDLLSKVTDDDVSHKNFPFAHCRFIKIADAKVLASRVTYVGELGWELHIPAGDALKVYEALWKAGQEFEVVNAGYRAIESLRLEKGYRYWSTDLTPDYTPFEAGIGFCVSKKKTADFIGRDALETARVEGPREVLVCMFLEKDVMLHGGETILRNGKVLGVLTSGGYGHTLKKTIAYGYVPAVEAKNPAGKFEIEVMGESIPAVRAENNLYDIKRSKIIC